MHHIPSNAQIADILTKLLSQSQFCLLRGKLNVMVMPLTLRGDVKVVKPSDGANGKANVEGVRVAG